MIISIIFLIAIIGIIIVGILKKDSPAYELSSRRNITASNIERFRDNKRELRKLPPYSEGYVYIAQIERDNSNQFTGKTKIGYTQQRPQDRIEQINFDANERPQNNYRGLHFDLKAFFKVVGCCELETLIHARLKGEGKWLWAETFDISVNEAVELIKDVAKVDNKIKILEFDPLPVKLIEIAVQCKGKTASGNPCSRKTRYENGYCSQHFNQSEKRTCS